MELCDIIKNLRRKSNMTQEQLAEKLGISAQSVSKWENAVAMPDIMMLPRISEVFGVSIDDLFDLTSEQKLNRIENRLDVEQDLPQDVFWDYEEFLKSQLKVEEHKKRATYLLAYLYWNRMDAASRKVSVYARRSIEMEPGEKKCQWMLGQAERHAVWDWNFSNHTKGIDFYRDIVEKNPDVTGPYYYLLDNLIADHRTDEAQHYLEKLKTLKDSDPIVCRCYQAHILLALFDEPGADRIMEDLLKENPDNSICLFESAQYYAKKCDYQKAIELYELSFEKTERRPKFLDELHGIADIYKIQGNYRKAVETYDRIIESMRTEWGMKDEVEIKDVEEERARLSTLI